jgi:hypothetical protein
MPPIGATAPTSQQPGTPLDQEQPTKSGWHLLQFANGFVAVVRYDKGAWQWGSQTPPNSNVLSMNYLGSNVQGMSLTLPKYAGSVGTTIWTTLVSSIDHGWLSQGQPIVIDQQGETPSDTSPTSQAGSEATASNIIPSPSISGVQLPDIFAGIWQWLTTASNWLRILEYVGGAVLIYLGIKGLTGIGPDLSDVAAVAAK